MEVLALAAMTVFRVHRVPVEFEGDIATPAFTADRSEVNQVTLH